MVHVLNACDYALEHQPSQTQGTCPQLVHYKCRQYKFNCRNLGRTLHCAETHWVYVLASPSAFARVLGDSAPS